MSENKINIAGVSLKGGRRDQFYFSLLEYYPNNQRWFLRSLLHVSDDESTDGNEAIKNWIDDHHITKLVVDTPLSLPPCHTCQLECPGISQCCAPEVAEVQKRIADVLSRDEALIKANPKGYERERVKDQGFKHLRDDLQKTPVDPLLSRSFKRRLKKGFLAYWNRPIDYWVWKYYYDALLSLFKHSYDSFGTSSFMVLSRFNYLKKHFPSFLQVYEGNVLICLTELLRSKILMKKDLLHLNDFEGSEQSRLTIIREIEQHFKLFIYDKDLELLVKTPRAFDSFILSVIGLQALAGQVRPLPKWVGSDQSSFLVPYFSGEADLDENS
jgi:hypothetical protein